MRMVVALGCACVLVLAAVLIPSDRVVAQSKYKADEISLDAANKVIAAAMKKADEIGVPMNITVLDAGGNLKAFARMDGALLGSVDISQKKALTSVLFRAPSGVIGTLSQPGGDLYGIERSNGGLITFGGGYPLSNADGKVIGAIGVSGGSVANDEEVGKAGVAGL